MKTVCVIIPIYKQIPDPDEFFSIRNTVNKMQGFPIYFVAPNKLNVTIYSQFDSVKIVRFANHYFKNIYGYNKLMLCTGFYKKFLDYEYMLIVQPDALIFRDGSYLAELMKDKDFDYWGAPWKISFATGNFNFYLYHKWLTFFSPVLRFFKKPERMCEVGNGGLSLRNVKKTIALLKNNVLQKTFWGAPEDTFYAYFGQENKVGFSLAPASLASKFSWEERLHDILHYESLPFGIHDWKRYFPDIMSHWSALQENLDLFHEPSAYKLGDTVCFCSDGFNATPYMLSGFYNCGQDGAWTVADRAELLFGLDGLVLGNPKTIHGEIFLSSSWEWCRFVNVYVNGRFCGQKTCDGGTIEFDFNLDSPFILLVLDMCCAFKPWRFYFCDERRKLGILIKNLRFVATPQKQEKFYIYGAGKVAHSVLCYMRSVCVEPIKCIVQSTEQNSDSLLGVPIVALDDVVASDTCVVVAVGRKFQGEVFDALRKKGFKRIELYSERFKKMLE